VEVTSKPARVWSKPVEVWSRPGRVSSRPAKEWFEKNRTLAAGCDAYFVKPLNTRTLSQQVAVVVARKAQGE
jgi:hypothetical protein